MELIHRRDFNKQVAVGVAGMATFTSPGPCTHGFAAPAEALKKQRPNFVFICSDQHSAKYAGYAGHPLVKTLNLDKIARRGVVFVNNYTGNPVCVPGRSCLMTGVYASDVNSFCNSTVYDGSQPTWGKRLRDAGYYCWATGKQDLNPEADLGFVDVNVDHGHARNPDITSLFRRPMCYRMGEREGVDGKVRQKPHSDEEDAARAVHFIRNEAPRLNKPWVAYVGFHQPHPAWTGLKEHFDFYYPRVELPRVTVSELENLPLPYQVMRNFKRISTPIPEERMKRARAVYFSMISELDEFIERVYRALEESGQLGNTYFIYTSDHGESLGEHGLWYKNNLYDSAAKVPLLIAGPGLPAGKVITTPVMHADLVATMLEWAQLGLPKELRGKSLARLINGEQNAEPPFAFSESHSEGNPTGSFMVRKGDWKLIHFSWYGDVLLNLKDDPGELNNLIDKPEHRRMADDLRATLRSVLDPEEVTMRAFAVQERVLQRFVSTLDERGLFDLLKGRLGEGQAMVLVKKLKPKA